MSIFMAIILGIIQGVAEFLPISSSGHLALCQALFGLQGTPLLFDVLLHFGTLISICAVFRKEIVSMLREVGGTVSDIVHKRQTGAVPPARRMVFLIIVGSLPLIPFVFLSDLVETAMSKPLIVGLFLCVTALVLFLSDRLPRGSKTEKNATLLDALVVGVCQGFAVMPGLSRSGMTISSGLFRRFDRGFAVRYSFLLSLPAVLGATLMELSKALGTAPEADAPALISQLPFYLIGMVVAAVFGYFAIGLVKRLVDQGKFGIFAYYCLAIGIISIVASFFVK